MPNKPQLKRLCKLSSKSTEKCDHRTVQRQTDRQTDRVERWHNQRENQLIAATYNYSRSHTSKTTTAVNNITVSCTKLAQTKNGNKLAVISMQLSLSEQSSLCKMLSAVSVCVSRIFPHQLLQTANANTTSLNLLHGFFEISVSVSQYFISAAYC